PHEGQIGVSRVGIPHGPERGLTVRACTRTVRPPPRSEGRDLDEVSGGGAAGRRGTVAEAASLWALCRAGEPAARCALVERDAARATRSAHGMNGPPGAGAGAD